MIRSRWITVSGLSVAVSLTTLRWGYTGAQTPEDAIVDIPGLGTVKVSEFPPEMRPYLRIPGVDYNDPPEEYGDLPAAPFPGPPDLLPPKETSEGTESTTDEPIDEAELSFRSEEHRRNRETLLRRAYEERAYPNDEIPPNAYREAWDYIQHMQEAAPPATPTPASEPRAAASDPRRWLGFLADLLGPRAALAQVPPTYQWTQIGPAPLINAAGQNNAGLIDGLAPDPQNPTTAVYVVTFTGGVWKSNNVGPTGTTWTPLTDAQPSLQYASVVAHPQNSQWLFAGSGLSNGIPDPNAPHRSIGAIRSTDGGANWCQIGPLCPNDTNCPPPSPDYTKSDLSVRSIGVRIKVRITASGPPPPRACGGLTTLQSSATRYRARR
jgi:hypothetical protein